MEENCPGIDHFLYRKATKETADAMAWVFRSKDEFLPYYFTFPEMQPDEFRGRILYTGLCHSDVSNPKGEWGPCTYPICPGHEVICEVTHIGPSVKNLKVGDIVGYGPFRKSCFNCKPCKKGADNICQGLPLVERLIYSRYFGGWCTHLQQPADHAIPLPKGMDLETIPPLLCAGVTVFAPMHRHIKEKGAVVAIIGIGGLGHLAIQYAKALGCHVVAVTTNYAKQDDCKKFGASEVILCDQQYEALKNHREKFDYIVNTLYVEPKAVEIFVDSLVWGGSLIQLGIHANTHKMELSFKWVSFKQITIYGSQVGSIKETTDCLEYAKSHKIHVEAEKYSFEELPRALDKLENSRPFYRCVVNVKDFVDKNFPKESERAPVISKHTA